MLPGAGVIVTPLQKRGGMGDEAYDAFINRSVEVTHPIGKVWAGDSGRREACRLGPVWECRSRMLVAMTKARQAAHVLAMMLLNQFS
jgi:hypothetical protein